jgi:beta-phosphoglucomutase
VIFDLDGTLVDNMAWHARAFDAFATRHGLPAMTLETRRRIDGKRNSEIFPLLFGRELPREEIRRYEAEKEGAYRDISRGAIQTVAGAARLLDHLEACAIPVAVATSAPAENVTHTLAEVGLASRLTLIVRGDEVPRGKPAPDVFLHAAARLGVESTQCLVFEDAPVGIAAAHAAGMPCVALSTSFSAESFAACEPPPEFTCADFDAYLAGPGAWLVTTVLSLVESRS